jgi:hypothetical protein
LRQSWRLKELANYFTKIIKVTKLRYKEDPTKRYNDFVGVHLSVPCKTWDADYAIDCFGPEYESKYAEGIVTKVRTTRNGKFPRFEVNFPEKRGVKTSSLT